MPTLNNNENFGQTMQDDAGSSMNDSGTGRQIDTQLTQPRSRPVRSHVYARRKLIALRTAAGAETKGRPPLFQFGRDVEELPDRQG